MAPARATSLNYSRMAGVAGHWRSLVFNHPNGVGPPD
jgi:hypothetical protein